MKSLAKLPSVLDKPGNISLYLEVFVAYESNVEPDILYLQYLTKISKNSDISHLSLISDFISNFSENLGRSSDRILTKVLKMLSSGIPESCQKRK